MTFSSIAISWMLWCLVGCYFGQGCGGEKNGRLDWFSKAFQNEYSLLETIT